MARTRYLGFLLTVVFLGLVFWKVDLTELRTALVSANYWALVPATLCTFVGYLVRTVRWRQILLPTRRITVRALFPVLMIGFMANNVLPARIGEFVRAYVLGRRTGVSKSLGLATIMVERLCDGLTLVLLMGLVAIFVPLPGQARLVAIVGGAVFIAAAVVAILVVAREELALRLLGLAVRPLPARFQRSIADKAASFVLGLRVLRDGRLVLSLVGLSIVIWACEAASYFAIIEGFDLGRVITTGGPLVAALVMLPIVNLGIMIPSAPGYVGTFQFFGVLALTAFGVPRAAALGVAIVSHAMQYVLVTAIGLVFFLRESLGWRALTEAKQSEVLSDEVLSTEY